MKTPANNSVSSASSDQIIWTGRDVLGFAIAERPVFFGDFNKIDDDIFPAQLYRFVQSIGNGFVEALFHFDAASGVESDLDEDAIVGTMNAEIVSIKLQLCLGMFGDDLEAIVLGDSETLEQRLVNDLTDLGAIFGRLALQKIDSDERHGFS
jgi:hypothetical protein